MDASDAAETPGQASELSRQGLTGSTVAPTVDGRQLQAALDALHDWALANRSAWPSSQPLDRVLRATFASATKDLGAVRLLTANGYGPGAIKICRSLFESMVVSYWVAFVADAEWVVKRMDEHLEFSALVLGDVLQDHPGWLPDGEIPKPPEGAVAERARLTAQYGNYCEKSWWAQDVEQKANGRWKVVKKRSLASLADDVLAVSPLEGHLWQVGEDGVPNRFVRELLDIPLRLNNQVLHHSPSGLARYLERGPEGLDFDDGPSEVWVPQAQASAFVGFYLLAELMVERYNRELLQSLEAVQRLFAASIGGTSA